MVVVEHNLELLAHADWIVDLGPGGGEHGGRLLFCGPLATFLDEAESPTAELLRASLRWQRGQGGSSRIRAIRSQGGKAAKRAS